MYPENFWRDHKYNDDIMWQEMSRAVVSFINRKQCFVFKENYLLKTIGGFKTHFQWKKIIYVDRDISSVYRSMCKAFNYTNEQYRFSKFLTEYSDTINTFTGSWAWNCCLKISYDMLINEKLVVIKQIADYLEIPIRGDRFDTCNTFIKPQL